MAYDIISFLLQVVISILAGAALLRAYIQAQRISFSNPLGQMVRTLTDWAVLPIRRVVQAKSRWDWVCIALAYFLILAQYCTLYVLSGAWHVLSAAPISALFALLRLVLSLSMGVLLVQVILSWVQPGGWLHMLTSQLTSPLLRPIRKIIPTAGGLDFSALVGLLLLQVLQIVLLHTERNLLGQLLS